MLQTTSPRLDATADRLTPKLAIVVPCHNEQEVLPATVAALRTLLSRLRQQGIVDALSYLCFVDDGSTDKTWKMITDLCEQHADMVGLKLARNFGHQGAVLAGMLECDADAVVTIDADLQDDENGIAEMVEKYRLGCEVVLGVRSDRSSDTFFKRATAEGYYRVLRTMGVRIVFNHADYRLMSRRALLLLREYGESNLFLRGVVPLLGLRSEIVKYVRRERQAGESKYPLRKMLALAWEGITSFSIVPLRTVSLIGMLIAFGSFLVALWALYQKLFGGSALPGWASTVVPMYFLGGIQVLCLGVIGEYIGKVYMETKRRPRYLIDRTVGQAQSTTPIALDSDQRLATLTRAQ